MVTEREASNLYPKRRGTAEDAQQSSFIHDKKIIQPYEFGMFELSVSINVKCKITLRENQMYHMQYPQTSFLTLLL